MGTRTPNDVTGGEQRAKGRGSEPSHERPQQKYVSENSHFSAQNLLFYSRQYSHHSLVIYKFHKSTKISRGSMAEVTRIVPLIRLKDRKLPFRHPKKFYWKIFRMRTSLGRLHYITYAYYAAQLKLYSHFKGIN